MTKDATAIDQAAATLAADGAAVIDRPSSIGAAPTNGAGRAAKAETFEDAVSRLSNLPRHEYDVVRHDEAKKRGWRLSTLDDAVDRKRDAGSVNGEAKGQGRPVKLHDPEPWEDEVSGPELLRDLAAAFACHLVLPKHADVAMALWCLHTHVFERFDHTPRLVFTSPTMRSGKTQALRAIAPMVPRPVRSANVTAPYLFRVIELARPVLLIDEGDSFASENNELRGIINAGHERDGTVGRTVGDDHEPREFNVFAPLAIASIGKLWTTVNDRGILIHMRRRKKSEPIARITRGAVEGLAVLGRRCARWAADNSIKLENADPSIPEALGDRECDNWRCLFAIADLCGDGWPVRARQAALALSPGIEGDGDEEADGVRLLGDIKAIFEKEAADQLSSDMLTATLGRMEERPWPEFGKAAKPITTRQLAALLRPFGIKPSTIRTGASTPKGYRLAQFLDAFERYLSPIPPLSSATPPQGAETVAFPGFFDPQHDPLCCGSNLAANPSNPAGCGVVAVENGGEGENAGDGCDEWLS